MVESKQTSVSTSVDEKDGQGILKPKKIVPQFKLSKEHSDFIKWLDKERVEGKLHRGE